MNLYRKSFELQNKDSIQFTRNTLPHRFQLPTHLGTTVKPPSVKCVCSQLLLHFTDETPPGETYKNTFAGSS